MLRHDQSTGFRDRYHWGRETWRVERFNYNIGLSYVTGSHNFKVGTNNSWGPYEAYRTGNGDLERQMYRNGVPEFARVSNRPVISGIDYARDLGIFAQDTWTIDRLTLNLGLRWEQMIAHTYEAGPNVAAGPRSTITQTGRFVAAQTFASRRNLPNWKDFAPRLGLSYDVFGDASTALKVSWGRYKRRQHVHLRPVVQPGVVPAREPQLAGLRQSRRPRLPDADRADGDGTRPGDRVRQEHGE